MSEADYIDREIKRIDEKIESLDRMIASTDRALGFLVGVPAILLLILAGIWIFQWWK